MEHNPISDNRRVSVSNDELGMRNVVSLHRDSERVSHRSHRFAQILSLQAMVLYTSTLTVKKICVICGKIKHSTLIINKNEKGNNSESNQLRHHRPHCRPQRLLCAELQVIAFEHELHESNESICSMAIFVSFLPTLALQPRRNLWKTSSTVSPSTIPMPRF